MMQAESPSKHLRIQRLESDVDPFDLFGSSKPERKARGSCKQQRDSFKAAMMMTTEATPSTAANSNLLTITNNDTSALTLKRAGSAHNTKRRPSNEIFKILDGLVSEKQVVPFENEETKYRERQQERERQHT